MSIDKKRVKVLTLREEKAKDEAINEVGGRRGDCGVQRFRKYSKRVMSCVKCCQEI